VQLPGVISGLRSALTLGILLLVVAILITPQVDPENAIFRREATLYTLLLAAMSIVALRITIAARAPLVCVFDFAATPLARRLPSATVHLLC
jgi:hypothetical protein